MKKRVALCLRGGVARQKARIRRPNELDDYPYDINDNHHYIKKEACYNSIKKHIIDSNPEYDFDVFIHCWELVLEKDMVELYKPKLYKFEDNLLWRICFPRNLFRMCPMSRFSSFVIISHIPFPSILLTKPKISRSGVSGILSAFPPPRP
jgi:hypothetical protein